MTFNNGDRVIWNVPSKNLCGEYGTFIYSQSLIDEYGGQELSGVVEYQKADNNWGCYPDGQHIHPFKVSFDNGVGQFVLPEQLRHEDNSRFDAQFVESFLGEMLKGGAIYDA